MSSRTAGKSAARERVEAMRAAQVAKQKRQRVLAAVVAIALVLLVVGGFVVAKAAGVGSGTDSASTVTASGAAPAKVVDAVTKVPAATLDAVGVGTAQAAPRAIKAPALTSDGKPRVLYVGADYCPFCAAERWPVVVALSRFGTWSDLGVTESSSSDVFPNTPSLSFHGASYTSDYLSFTGVETAKSEKVNGQYPPLDELSAADQKIFDTYNRPPYTAGTAGGIPFLNLAGQYVSSGASYPPDVLKGKSRAQIAAALADPTNDVSKAVNGSANVITAALCDVTKGQPTTVCTSPGVKAAAAALATSQQQ